MATITGPTLEGYLLFIRNVMGIPPEILPDDAPIIEQSYTMALTLVNPYFQYVSGVPMGAVPLVFDFKKGYAIDARGPMVNNE